jgi:hypothetical protein
VTPLIFGIGNKARNGKDTAAEGMKDFCDRYGMPFLKVGFADALRQEVTEAIKFYDGNVQDLVEYGTPDDRRKFPSWVEATPNAVPELPLLPYGKHSKILQWWGTEYRRAQDPNYWINKWLLRVVGFSGVVVAPDVRFNNEAIAILECGGANVNVRRLNEEGTQFFDSARPANHPSETELDSWNWDFRIIAKTGQVSLVKAQAIEILKYQMRLKNGWTE